MTEIWKPVPGFSKYEASNRGRVRSIDRLIENTTSKGTPYTMWRRGTILKPGNVQGYKRVVLCKHGKEYGKYVHQIIARTFHGKAPAGKTDVMHLDDDKTNNRPRNLQWGTRKENMEDRNSKERQARGSGSGKAVLTEKEVLKIVRLLNSGVSRKEVRDMFGVGTSTIRGIVIGRTWGHITGIKIAA